MADLWTFKAARDKFLNKVFSKTPYRGSCFRYIIFVTPLRPWLSCIFIQNQLRRWKRILLLELPSLNHNIDPSALLSFLYMDKYTGRWADSHDAKRSTCVSCWPPEDWGTTPLTPNPWKDWPLPGDKLVWEKFHDPDKISECPTSPLLVEVRRGCYVVYGYCHAPQKPREPLSELLIAMCSYHSTCDHLPLANLCHKEANHPISSVCHKLNTDSTSLGPPLLLGSVHHFTDSLASRSIQNRGSYPRFHLYLKGTKMYLTQVHSCLEMFDSIEILVDKNLVILSTGSITRNSFESHCRHKYSNFCLGCRWHFFKFRRNPAWSTMSKTILVWKNNCPVSFPDALRNAFQRCHHESSFLCIWVQAP